MARHNRAKARTHGQKAMAVKTHTAHELRELTMQQEARNTEGRSTWRMGSNFRHQAVQFVSAGSQETQETQPDCMNIDVRHQESAVEPDSQGADQADNRAASNHPQLSNEPAGGNTTQSWHSNSESTSEDEVVFPGRRKEKGHVQQPQDQDRHTVTWVNIPPDGSSLPRQGESAGLEGHDRASPGPHGAKAPLIWPSERAQSTHMDEQDGFLSFKAKPPLTRKGKSKSSKDGEDDILADYIANIDEEYKDLHLEFDNQTSRRTLTSPSTESIDSSDIEVRTSPGKIRPPGPGGILLNREGENCRSACECPIHVREGSEQPPHTHPGNGALNSASSSASCASDTNEIEESVLEGDANSHRLLERGNPGGYLSCPRRDHSNAERQYFASATAFANALESDPFYGFDIMDFNRPSVRRKTKGKQPAFGLLISDSELELELERAWRNDREKKKTRKQRREELRAQGLLGRNADAPDLELKYSNGIDISDLKLETRKFLLSSKISLALPPMAKQHRKFIHDMAGSLSLKSQSRGKGSARFPILHKTSRTPRYTEKTISRVDDILSKAKLSHQTPRSWDQNRRKSAKPRRDRPESSVSYMDGDVVGASAPAIGAENKGRAMLEKMGWSSGTPLGSLNNKGILLPVAHVVKNSKAGLG